MYLNFVFYCKQLFIYQPDHFTCTKSECFNTFCCGLNNGNTNDDLSSFAVTP